ncbi:MAG: glutathione S-transferase family protein [Pseudomonadota bacterium]|nr:glutathione S-transferase family protein [Pseudomonadota bacterium]
MQLYSNKFSRGTRPRWLLEESGLACEIVNVDMAAREHKSEAYLKLHPHGVVPVLVDGDTRIFESAAITLYLADKVPGLAPEIGTRARGEYYQWAVWSMVTLEPGVTKVFYELRKPEAERDAAVIAEGTRMYHECLRVLTDAIEGREWLVGDTFSAADILVIAIVAWAGVMKLNEGFPVVEAYAARGKARPAFLRARS